MGAALALRRWWSQPDHFHWVTSFLAARNVLVALRHAMAATFGGVGLLILATIGSPSGPQGLVGRTVAISVAVCAAAIAVGCLVVTRPSPTVSAGFGLVSAVAISALSLVQRAPLAGLLASTGFAVLGGYLAFFHTPRLLAVNGALAAGTTLILAVRLAESGDLTMAIAAFGFLMIVNLAIPLTCQGVVHLLGIDVLNTDIDPLTGLLNRQAFYRNAATFIATRNRADDRYFVLLYVSLDAWDVLASADGAAAADRSRVEVAQALRDTTRHDAVCGHLPEADFLIADCFAAPDATPLVERVLGAIAISPARITASIGVVSAPVAGLAENPPQTVLDELLAVAATAMTHARRDGGNDARHVSFPDIAFEDGQLDER